MTFLIIPKITFIVSDVPVVRAPKEPRLLYLPLTILDRLETLLMSSRRPTLSSTLNSHRWRRMVAVAEALDMVTVAAAAVVVEVLPTPKNRLTFQEEGIVAEDVLARIICRSGVDVGRHVV
jgi:hypothetical protein